MCPSYLKMVISFFLTFSFYLLVLTASGCSSVNEIHSPIAIDEPLPFGHPESVGMDYSRLENISNQLDAMDRHEVHSMLVMRDSVLVFEEYYNGYGRDNPHDMRSVTKSITSLLTGIAIDQSILSSLDSAIMDYLAWNYPNVEGKSDISIRHLLSMTSGLDCDDFNHGSKGQEDRIYRTQDWVASYLELPIVYPPGEVAQYCSAGVIALGEIISLASGMDFEEFADKALFDPLGIDNYRWAKFDENEKVDTGGHLLLTPQGMIKLGQLLLQEGNWKGQQLVSTDWTKASTSQQVELRETSYGFLWWLGELKYGEKEFEVIWASGNGGQLIFIVPEYSLVTVFTAGFYNSDKTEGLFDIFFRGVLPSIVELQPYIQAAPSFDQ